MAVWLISSVFWRVKWKFGPAVKCRSGEDVCLREEADVQASSNSPAGPFGQIVTRRFTTHTTADEM